ncbi:MAG: universal stress protein [Deltaproteobacteria bacterium]
MPLAPDPAPTSRPYPVVVGIDFTESDNHTFARALAVAAERPGAHLHFLHAGAGPVLHGGSSKALERSAELLEEIPRRLRAHLAGLGAAAPPATDSRLTIHARLGAPAAAILQLAVDVRAELILLGVHHRRGLLSLTQQSVVAQVLGAAHCPVLVVRPTDYAGVAQQSEAIDPICPDCARTRSESGNERMWCEYHARPHIQMHGYGWSDVFPVGGHDPGIIPMAR